MQREIYETRSEIKKRINDTGVALMVDDAPIVARTVVDQFLAYLLRVFRSPTVTSFWASRDLLV